MKRLIWAALVPLFVVFANPLVQAFDESDWEDLSDVTAYGLIGTALFLPVYREDTEGAWQAFYSVGTSAAVTLVGKNLTDKERPDESDNNSFPSGHTSNSFAAATTLHRRYGWQVGFPAYALATLTGVARERARKHDYWDVVAGAAVGTLSGWYFTEAYDGKVQLVPWIEPGGGGVSLSIRW